jgi:hypothetical protein
MVLQTLALNLLFWQYVTTVPAVAAYYLSPYWRWV